MNPLDKLKEIRVLFPEMDTPDASGSSALYREWKKLRDAEITCPVKAKSPAQRVTDYTPQRGSVPERILNGLNGHAVTTADLCDQFPSLLKRQIQQGVDHLLRGGLVTRIERGTILKVEPQRERESAHGS